MGKPTLYGFDGSTFVRAVRMLLAEKNIDYDQVPVDVLKGEPSQPEHLARNPFGKVPVFDHNGVRIYETSAIIRYIERALSGPSFTPDSANDQARMNMAIGIIDSFGYSALVGGVAAYHLFPEYVGGKSEEKRSAGIKQAKTVLSEVMKLKGRDDFIAGPNVSLADFYVAPPCAYVALTPDWETVVGNIDGFQDWWARITARESFLTTRLPE